MARLVPSRHKQQQWPLQSRVHSPSCCPGSGWCLRCGNVSRACNWPVNFFLFEHQEGPLAEEQVGFRVFCGNSSQESSGMMRFPVAPPGATMALSFQSDEDVLRKLRE